MNKKVMEYRYSLKRKSNPLVCPNCKEKRFTPYVDNATDIPLHDGMCGRCSREYSCGYHYPPREFFRDYPEYRPENDKYEYEIVYEEVPISFIDKQCVTRVSKRRKENLTNFLVSKFGAEKVNRIIDLYQIGFDEGRIIFWQIDVDGDVRTGKKIQYSSDGKRKFMYLLHKELGDDEFVLEECFFGEHLLNQFPEKEVRIVESEKTCLIAAIAYPEFIWLATGGKYKCAEKSWPNLADRKITLVPDEDAIQHWEELKEDMELALVYTPVQINDVCRGKESQCDIGDLILNCGI